jgi:hypothetical protein
VSIETAARSLFRAIENRDLEWITGALDNPLEYYQQGSIPSSKAIAIIQSDWRRYSNWRGTISDFRSTDPLSCTFTLSYSLLEGNRTRAASMKHALSLSPNWPHRISKITGVLLKGDTGSAARPAGQQEEPKSLPSALPAPEKRYRINNIGGQAKVLLKRKPDPASETVTQVPNTTTGIIITGEATGPDRNWVAVKIGNLSGFFLHVENLSLMDAPRFVSITPGKVEESWASAVSKYPDLGVEGSPTQEKFSLRVRAVKLTDPRFFRDSGWPLAVANEVFATGRKSTLVRDAQDAQGWQHDPTFKAVEQTMTNMYRTLTEQFGTSPLTGQLRGEQAAWVERRNTLAATQPAELQTAMAIQMTSDRLNRLNGLRQILDRPATGWKMYSGALPSGRYMHLEQAAYLTSLPVGKPFYVGGTLVVTAIDGNRVVLRGGRYQQGPNVRMIVEYPEGMRLPAQGSVITRPPDRGFLVQQIRRSPDGPVDILAREILSE